MNRNFRKLASSLPRFRHCRSRIVGSGLGLLLLQPLWTGAEDNTSTVISGVVSNNGGANFYVGNTGTNNMLLINSAGVLTGVSDGYVGNALGASGNTVLVQDADSRWNISRDFLLGNQGGYNSMIISNGGTVYVQRDAAVGLYGSSVNNTAIVTGSNSLWQVNGYLNWGHGSSSNQLFILDGGTVNTRGALIGATFAAVNNTAVVDGAGSRWDNSYLVVGNDSAANALIIRNGGAVSSQYGGYIGANSGSSNTVLVTGGGSRWDNALDLTIGQYGTANSLTISNGGTLNDVTGYIGNYAGANSNTVTVTDSSSRWNNSGELYVGNFGSGNTLTITNGGTVHSAGNSLIGSEASATGNRAIVTGSDSLWISDSRMYIGYQGANNSLAVLDGGAVTNGEAYLGYGATATGNTVTVSGSGSRWVNNGEFSIGYLCGGNSLTILDSGVVQSVNTYIGRDAWDGLSNSNNVTVSGAGAAWNNSSALVIGEHGRENSVTVSNGGVINSGSVYVGYYADANSNTVTVTGPGSVWSNNSKLYLGYNGSGNSLTIAAGGTVYNAAGIIGNSSSASNNTVTVTGTGSLWQNNGQLSIGWVGGGNQVTISDGGRVNDTKGIVGYDGANNGVLVTGNNSVWNSSGDLNIGDHTSGNWLTITNGGNVLAGGMSTIGYAATSTNNTVLVTDTGSVWTNGQLYVGNNGSGNRLTITNGGQVINGNGSVGYNSGANNNTATVTGSGSSWINDSLSVGGGGSGNTLIIANGGTVSDGVGVIGDGGGANNNAVSVTGSGSAWTNRGGVYVGAAGSGNSLLIANSGTVS